MSRPLGKVTVGGRDLSDRLLYFRVQRSARGQESGWARLENRDGGLAGILDVGAPCEISWTGPEGEVRLMTGEIPAFTREEIATVFVRPGSLSFWDSPFEAAVDTADAVQALRAIAPGAALLAIPPARIERAVSLGRTRAEALDGLLRNLNGTADRKRWRLGYWTGSDGRLNVGDPAASPEAAKAELRLEYGQNLISRRAEEDGWFLAELAAVADLAIGRPVRVRDRICGVERAGLAAELVDLYDARRARTFVGVRP